MKVVALFVTYNRLEKLKKSLQAALNLPFYRVIVVNNASTDGTACWLDNNTDERLIAYHLSDNRGGAYGFKYGSQKIATHFSISDWVLFLDDDAYPAADFFAKFAQYQREDCAIYNCKVVNEAHQLCAMNLPWKKRPSTFWQEIAYLFNKKKFLPTLAQLETIVSTSFVGMVIAQPLLATHLNYIHEDLFIYYDDVYFSHHMVLTGQTILYLPDTTVIHTVASNYTVEEPWKIYYLIRNLLLSKFIFGKKQPFRLFTKLAKITKYFLLGLRSKNRIASIKMLTIGIYHGILNISGKKEFR